jgi:hypothetical protein
METLTFLPIKIILEELTFQDYLNLLWTPKWRAILKEYFRRDMNQRDIIRSGLLEIFDRFIPKVSYSYIIEIHDFLVNHHGFDSYVNSNEQLAIKLRFTTEFTVNEISSIEPEKSKELSLPEYQKYIATQYETFQMIDNVFENYNLDIPRRRRLIELHEISEDSEEYAMKIHTADLLEKYFYHPVNGFRNVLQMFELLGILQTRNDRTRQKFAIELPLKRIELIEKLMITY